MAKWIINAHMPEGTTTIEVEANDLMDALTKGGTSQDEVEVEAYNMDDPTAPTHSWTVTAESPVAAIRAAALEEVSNT